MWEPTRAAEMQELLIGARRDNVPLGSIHKLWKRVHLLDVEEAHQFIGNGIVVNDRYIAPRMTPQIERIVAEEGLSPVIVDTSEFEKSGGSCFCMKTFFP